MAVKSFSIDESLAFGWGVMKSNFLFFVGVFVISVIVSIIPSLFANTPGLVQLIVNIAGAVANMLIAMGMIKIALKFASGQKGSFSDLYDTYPLFWKYLGAAILYGLIVVAGTVLLVIPGIIWGLMFAFNAYLVIDKGLGPVDALKRSSAISKGVKWQMIGFGAAAVIVNLLGALCLLVGLLATVPTTMVAWAYIYRSLEAQS